MIDWFIVLIPLALLPIFLCAAFVGCALEGFNRITPLYFSYAPNLDSGQKPSSDIQRFVAEFEFQDEIIKTIERVNPVFEDPETDPPKIDANGEKGFTVASIELEAEGTITCTCHITLQSGTKVNPSEKQCKQKTENNNSPSFTLERDPDPSKLFRII